MSVPSAPRRYHEAPLALVIVVLAVGFALVVVHHWRRGLVVIGCGIALAAVLRGALPPRRAGLLAVRGRVLDTAVLAVLGVAVLFLASIVRG